MIMMLGSKLNMATYAQLYLMLYISI
jgi:hypothetical protein